MAILIINNAQGEENLEIDCCQQIVSISTKNVYDGKETLSFCELSNDQVKEVIETLKKLVR